MEVAHETVVPTYGRTGGVNAVVPVEIDVTITLTAARGRRLANELR